MLFREETTAQGDRLLIWKMEESQSELLSRFTILRGEYEAAVAKFRSPKRVEEFLSVRALLRIALDHDVRVAHDEKGKPFLPEEPGWRLSISHTKQYASVYLSQHREVGVDIEQMSERIFRVKDKFLNEAERALLDERDRVQLLLCWSAKEAVYKVVPGLKADYWEEVFVKSLDLEKGEMVMSVKGADDMTLRFRTSEDFVIVYN